MKYNELISKLCERAPWCPDTEAKLMAEAANAIADLIFALKASNDVIVNNKPKWIPVTDKLPQKCQFYLVTDFGVVEEAYYNSDCLWISRYDDKLKDVTHWMPLPQPPKEETDG